MNQDLEHIMAAKTDEELNDYISINSQYTQEEIEAATNEWKKRGRVFSEEELKALNPDFKNKGLLYRLTHSKYFKSNIVDYPSAPLLYTKGLIILFTLFTSAIAGGILMAMNLYKMGQKGAAAGAIIFALIFRSLTSRMLTKNLMEGKNMYPTLFAANGIAAFVFISLFWNIIIGQRTRYRARSFWPPVFVFLSLLLLSVILRKSLGISFG